MIIIPLRPVLTNLVVTIVNGIAELLCLSAMLVILALYECRRWTNGASVSIKWHCRQVKVITLFAIIMFIATESILSAKTATKRQPLFQNYSCVKTEINLRQDGKGKNDKHALAVTHACMRLKKTTFSFRVGAFIDTDDGNFKCSGKPKYEYDENGTVDRSITGAEQYCEGETCVFVSEQVQDNITTIFLSKLVISSETEKQGNVTKVFVTKIFFNHTEELSVMAKIAYKLYTVDEVNDEFETRRRVFFGARKGICQYPKEFVEYSKIPKNLFWGMICLWIFMLLAFLVLYLNKKRVFYEIRNVWDWARKTHQRVDSDVRENMHFVWVEVNGERRMYLTDSREIDQILKEDSVQGGFKTEL